MNKKQKLFFILGIISFSIGFAMVFICSFNEKFDVQLTITEKIIVGMIGGIFIIGALACFVLYLKNFINHDENLIIEEYDERNIMIRGKVAEISMLTTTSVMLIVECILIGTGESIAAFLVAIAMFLCGFIQILLTCYYHKKY